MKLLVYALCLTSTMSALFVIASDSVLEPDLDFRISNTKKDPQHNQASSIPSNISTIDYLLNLQQKNKISYNKIVNTAGSYIPSLCYTKTVFEDDSQHNPCYACHIRGQAPNYVNTSRLQVELDFPPDMRVNPFDNLFEDRRNKLSEVSDQQILAYIRKSNYQENGKLILTDQLPKDWPGYRPDAFYQFDKQGFDRTPEGGFSLWRAYRYYPFLGTFWPTNGSTDDVLIRLRTEFSQDLNKKFDLTTYKLNLAIVESLIKREDVQLSHVVDENYFGEDFNRNGKLDKSHKITFPPQHYVGHANLLLQDNKIHLAAGLFPEGTEFLHSVRYLDWDNKAGSIKLSARMKELRYAKKYRWFNYSELKEIAQKEFLEAQYLENIDWKLETFRGNPQHGLRTASGWLFQGFIEDNAGQLRPQTREETIYCMGCHSGTGATADAIFSFARKFSEKLIPNSWQHWSQKGLVGIREPKASYQNHADVFEYSFYLQNNPTGNDFASNNEVLEKFFDKEGNAKPAQFDKLKEDISILLYPSFERAMELNKGYKFVVEDQSFIYGREGNTVPFKNIYETVKDGQMTGLKNIIVR